jgi:hypothetical protein
MAAFAVGRRMALGGFLVIALASLTRLAGPSVPARAQEMPSRQVTLFGIVATPGKETVDKELKTIEPQLRQLLPGHGFKLLEVQSKRLTPGESVACKKLNGFVAELSLLSPIDTNGKVQLRFAMGTKTPGSADGQGIAMESATIVATPPNQLAFFDKKLPDGAKLIIGMGAR